MHTHADGSTTPELTTPNAFTADYLAALAQRDEPVTASEADVAGPWHLEPHPLEQGWAVFRQGQSRFSTQAHASFQSIAAARLVAAVLPSTGRRPRYRLGKERDALGYPVFDGAELVGHFQFFDDSLLAALNVVAALVSVPADLAWLLDAAGGPTLERAGQIAFQRSLPEF